MSELPSDAPWWARWLVEEWREWWQWASVRWTAFCAVVMEVYALDAEKWNELAHQYIPAKWWPHFIAAGFAITAILRVLNLKK